MAAVQLLLFDFLYTTQVSRFSCSQDCPTVSGFPGRAQPACPKPTHSSPRGRTDCRGPVLQNGFFNNKLYFFQAFLSYLYLLSFVLHEDFLWDAGTIEPVRIFLQVIGIPAWSLPEV